MGTSPDPGLKVVSILGEISLREGFGKDSAALTAATPPLVWAVVIVNLAIAAKKALVGRGQAKNSGSSFMPTLSFWLW